MRVPAPSLSLKAAQFLDFVLKLQPKLAVFDCDGTLWRGDAGEGFFHWELERGVVADPIVRWAHPRYADYKKGNVDEDTMCAEMVTMHRGLKEDEIQEAATEYFERNFIGEIFTEMRELVRRLRDSGADVWAVSSTNVWVIRAGMKHFDIPQNRILAATAAMQNDIVTDRIVRLPTGTGKPKAIQEAIQERPDAAFGNSRFDTEMLEMSRHAFAVNPNPDLEKTATEAHWTIYRPDPL